jgi:hypothetical protein
MSRRDRILAQTTGKIKDMSNHERLYVVWSWRRQNQALARCYGACGVGEMDRGQYDPQNRCIPAEGTSRNNNVS